MKPNQFRTTATLNIYMRNSGPTKSEISESMREMFREKHSRHTVTVIHNSAWQSPDRTVWPGGGQGVL